MHKYLFLGKQSQTLKFLTYLDTKYFHLIWLPINVSTEITTIDLGFVTTPTGALNFAARFLDVN
jgi:hypothetical protein